MKMRLLVPVLLAVAVLLSASTAGAKPSIHVEPNQMSTPGLLTGQAYSENLYIYNETEDTDILYVTLEEEEPVAWLWFNQTSVTVAPKEEVAVVVNFIARAVPCMDGVYRNTILVHSNDPKKPVVKIPVKIQAMATQRIYPVDNLIWFGIVYGPDMELIRLMNGGCQNPLTITSITTSDVVFWLPLLKFPIVVQPYDEFRFYLQFVAPAYQYGTYLGTMTVTSDDPVTPVVEIPIEAFYVGGGGPASPLKSGAAVRQSTWGAIKSLYK
jgi:hypothetical protein